MMWFECIEYIRLHVSVVSIDVILQAMFVNVQRLNFKIHGGEIVAAGDVMATVEVQ